jgi:hypothetical protein
MNFAEYWNKGKIYQHDPYIPACKNCEGIAAEYAWNDCKDEVLFLIDKFKKEYKGDHYESDNVIYLLTEKIKKEI